MTRFSVVIPSYNRLEFLKVAVRSVLKQTYRDLELIISDDGSDDGTRAFINSIPDGRIKYIFNENRGVSAARNRALEIAEGEYIAFLDSDDRWLPEKLETVDSAIFSNPEYAIFHTLEKWNKNGKHLNQKKKHLKKSGNIFKYCLGICGVSISTAVVNREVFNDIGYFDETLPACEDYDFWVRTSLRYEVYLVEKILTLKEAGHPDQLSQKFWGMDRFRIKSIMSLLDNWVLEDKDYIAAYIELKKKCTILAGGSFKREKAEEGHMYMDIIKRYDPFIARINE